MTKPGQQRIPGLTARRRVGRVERAVGASIVAGRNGAGADARFKGAETLAREIAAAVDAAAADQQVYAVAQLAPRLLATLHELGLTPDAVKDDDDPLRAFLSELSEPEIRDTPV